MALLDYIMHHNRYMNCIGVLVVLCIALCFSFNRKKINVRLIGVSLLLQYLIAMMMLKTTIGSYILGAMSKAINGLYACADVGIMFLFGQLANPAGPWQFIFAIKVLPIVIFFGAITSILFHFGIIQKVVAIVSYVIRPILGTSGAETLCAIANSFLGQTEAPLVIRSYLTHMSKSELFVVMVSGMATISGAILMVYAQMGVPAVHLLTASMMAIPASILIAKIIIPQEDENARSSKTVEAEQQSASNIFDAIWKGTTDGLHLAINVAAMLISFLALITLINFLLSYVGMGANNLLRFAQVPFRFSELTLQKIFSHVLAPFGYLFGFTGKEAQAAGQLLGTKIAVNEMIAYGDLVRMNLSERAHIILTYALCGFSNFSCIGIQLGGIGALAPDKRPWLSELGLYAVLAAALSNIMSALVIAFLI
ncbi:putative transporter [Candidatus Dependentiae bacterium Noda2021]|nr:putative transporter [Candidatus Dependentiae bacterium Noda2021]